MKFDYCLEILCKFFEHHFAFFLKQSGLIDSVTKVSNSKMTLINLLSLKKCTFAAFECERKNSLDSYKLGTGNIIQD